MRRSLRASSLVVLSLALSLPAMAYTLVNTSAPPIHCVYNPSCTMSGTDLISTMANGGKIASRYYQAQAGSPAAGNWVYRYRIDMTNAASTYGAGSANSARGQVFPRVRASFFANRRTKV